MNTKNKMKIRPQTKSKQTHIIRSNTLPSNLEPINEIDNSLYTNDNNNKTTNKLVNHAIDIFSLMKDKVPSFIFSMHLFLYSFIFVKYTIQYINSNCTFEADTIYKMSEYFWIYMPIMTVLCFAWEFAHCYITIKHRRNFIIRRKWWYCLLNSALSSIVFIMLIFYIDSNNTIYYITKYDKTLVDILYYLVFIIVVLVAFIDKICWTGST